MFAFGLLQPPAPVALEDFAGRYAFYDDGWPGTLTLSVGSAGNLQATFYSYRYQNTYEATCELDEQRPNQVRITLHGYNELARQIYTGYLFTRSKNAIAGWSAWKGTPYGFFARKSRPTLLGLPGLGKVEPDDFAGFYNFYYDGDSATLELRRTGSHEFQGLLSEHSGVDLPVIGRIDPEVAHKITITVLADIDVSDQPANITAFLFSWSRNAIAGSIEWAAHHMACYAVKFREG